MDEPLIYTTKGNLPVKDLTYHTAWEERDDATVFVEEHRLAGEVVKRSVHVRSKQGVAGLGVAAEFNGA